MTALTGIAPLPAATRRVGIDGALRSEWTKLRTVRSTMWSLLAMAGIAIGLMSLIAWATMHRWARFEPREQAALLHRPLEIILARPVFICQLVVAVLGVMVISAEYTTGMVRSAPGPPRSATPSAAYGLPLPGDLYRVQLDCAARHRRARLPSPPTGSVPTSRPVGRAMPTA
jgi:hypothetical protein